MGTPPLPWAAWAKALTTRSVKKFQESNKAVSPRAWEGRFRLHKGEAFSSAPSPGSLGLHSWSLVFSVPLAEGNDLPDVPLRPELPAPASASLLRAPSPAPAPEPWCKRRTERRFV